MIQKASLSRESREGPLELLVEEVQRRDMKVNLRVFRIPD
jgi:hypothetical protein